MSDVFPPEAERVSPERGTTAMEALLALGRAKLLTPEESERLQTALRLVLPLPPLIGSADARAVLREKYDDIENDGLWAVIEEELLAADRLVKSGNAAEAKQRLQPLFAKLKARGESVQTYVSEQKALTFSVVDMLRTTLDLPAESIALLTETITVGPPSPPSVEDSPLIQEHAELDQQWKRIMLQLGRSPIADAAERKEIAKQWKQYQQRVETFERTAEGAGRRAFMNDIDLPADMTDAEFQEMYDDVLGPLPSPESARNPKFKEQAKQWHGDIEGERTALRARLPEVFRTESSTAQRKIEAEHFAAFLVRRNMYEDKLDTPEKKSSKWALYAGMVTEEIWEEGMEEVLTLDRIEFIKNMDAGMRRKMVEGWSGCMKMLAARGVPVASMGRVLRYMDRLPMGPQFWRKMFTVQSPVTVFLLGYQLYQSPDKIKAAASFMSFVGISNLAEIAPEAFNASIAKLIQRAEKALDVVKDAKRVAVLQKRLAALKKLQRLGSIKVPSALKFAIILTAAFVFSDEIDGAMTWFDEQIPEGVIKEGIETGLQGLEAPFAHADDLLQRMGGYGAVQPEVDVMRVLGGDSVFGYRRTIEDWNERVDVAIAQQPNPILKELWELKKIKDPDQWAERQGVYLFTQASDLRSQEKQLGAEFVRLGILQSPDQLNATDIATAGENINDADLRNDKTLDRAFGWATVNSAVRDTVGPNLEGLAKAKAHIRTLKKDDPLRQSFEQYEAAARAVATEVSVYRHLGLYNRSRWLGDIQNGDGTAYPAHVQRGLVELIAYDAERNRVTRMEHTKLSPERYAESLTGALKMEDALPMSMVDRLLLNTYTSATEDWSRSKSAFAQSTDAIMRGKPGSDVTGLPETTESSLWNRARFELMLAAYDAGKVLPKDQVAKMLMEVRERIDENRPITREELDAKRIELGQAVLNARMEAQKLSIGGEEVRRSLGLNKLQKLFVRGVFVTEMSQRDMPKTNPVERAFASIVQSTCPDVLILEGSVGASDTMRLTTVLCGSPDPENWRVVIHSAQRTVSLGKGKGGPPTVDGISHNPKQEFEFSEWAKRNEELAKVLQPSLDAVQVRLQRESLVREQETKANQTKEQRAVAEARNAALGQDAEFVRAAGDYWVRYNGKAVFLRRESGSAYRQQSEPFTGTKRLNPDEDDAFRFQLRTNPDKPVDPWIVRSLDYNTEKNLMEDQKKLITDLLTTPLADDPRATVERLVQLCPRNVYRPSGIEGVFYSPRHYARELTDAVVPLYNQASDKQAFLCKLIEQLRRYSVIGEEAAREIPKALAA